ALLSFPFLLLLSNWFRHASARAYRRTREAVALVIVHFVESLGGIRAVQAFRREPRNQEIFEAVNDDYRRPTSSRSGSSRSSRRASNSSATSRSQLCSSTAPTGRWTAASTRRCSWRSYCTCAA